MPDQSLTPDYFDAVYAANADPWHFTTSDYERAKYAATVAALPKPIYRLLHRGADGAVGSSLPAAYRSMSTKQLYSKLANDWPIFQT